ncbi:hypothetical protein TanjilG_16032 [Lupinus angustifolius]|uniref:RING-type E3 ubiquitin transferase n=1 Tax=Lupinus angustifolius TaxID=3871 RepID=A0A4P1RGQ3_LUPAN|nr:PREDICTED: probable E3 ubiquitin-protein ligase RHG1A [Lupinus angustifolius]OIW10660.1 hypothetical protein TanjilG_16032 [Lupinus angustifolius]
MNNEDTDLSAQDLENNHPQNLNLSLSLSINQSESQNQMTSTFPSAQTEVNVGATRSVGQEGRNGVLSANTSRLIPSKRRYSDLQGTRDFIRGESSRIGARAGRARQSLASSQANTNTNLIGSSYRNELPDGDHFQGETFRNVRPFSNIQNPVGEVQSNGSNFNLQTTTNATATATPRFILPATRRLPNIHHTWGLQLPLTSTPLSFFQSHRPPFISSSPGAANGSTSSVQPVLYAPHIISSVNAHPIGRSVHYETISGARPPFLNQRNIHENVVHTNRGIGTGDQDISPGITGLAIRPTYQYGSYYNTIRPSNAQIRVTGSTQQRPQVLDLSLGLGHSGTVNEGSSAARFETQPHNNSVPFLTTMFQLPDPRSNVRWLNRDDQVNTAINFLEAALHRQQVGHLQYEDVIDFARNLEELIERHAVTQEQTAVANIGLTDENILKYIKREKFELVGEDTPENKEKCCICQATYIDGEEVGKLDCVHRFHVDCIRQWLVIKNICPVCKQTGLAVDGNDE